MQPVILPPTSRSIYDGNEPQMIQQKSPNRLSVHYDFRWGGEEFNQNPSDSIISTRITQDSTPSIIASGINRISVTSCGFYNAIPNINPRNNQIIFFSEPAGASFEVFIPEGFYSSPGDVMTAIVDAMNTVSGSSLLTFSAALVYPGGATYELSTAAGGFRILPECNAVTRGFVTYNFEVNSFNTGSIRVGSISMYYTRFIDFLSTNITRFNKVQAISNNSRNSFIYRCFVQSPGVIGIVGNFNANGLCSTFNYSPDQPLYEIDIQLIDQFGDPLYIPEDNNYNNVFYDIEFVFE